MVDDVFNCGPRPFFPYLCAMKKRIATYIFLVGFVLFSTIKVADACPKTGANFFESQIIAGYLSAGIKSGQPGDADPDKICRSECNIHHASCSQMMPLLPDDCSSLLYPVNILPAVTLSPAVAPDGYLLHLFPSHYFW